METSITKAVEKIVEQSQTPIEKYWSRLEDAVDNELLEKAKQELKLEEMWDSLLDDTDANGEETDKAEQIEKLLKEYLDDLKNNSEYSDTIENDGEPYEKLSPEETAEKRAEFNANKERLIKEWEEKTGKEWPRYKEDVYVNGNLVRKAGDRYDAHHIHPLSLGGKNESSNITPISAEKHFDKQGVHAPDSPYGKLEKTLQEVKS